MRRRGGGGASLQVRGFVRVWRRLPAFCPASSPVFFLLWSCIDRAESVLAPGVHVVVPFSCTSLALSFPCGWGAFCLDAPSESRRGRRRAGGVGPSEDSGSLACSLWRMPAHSVAWCGHSARANMSVYLYQAPGFLPPSLPTAGYILAWGENRPQARQQFKRPEIRRGRIARRRRTRHAHQTHGHTERERERKREGLLRL